MKKNRLLSLGAIALTIACSTSVSAYAAEYNKTPKEAKEAIIEMKMAEKAYKGGQVINGLNITIDTKVKEYATSTLIKELDEQAAKFGLNYDYNAGLKDNFLDIQASSVGLTSDDEKLTIIKDFINEKLNGLKAANEAGTSISYVNKYIKVNNYGSLKMGVNLKDGNAVALFDKKGQLLAVVGNDEIEKTQKRLDRVESWDQLIRFLDKNSLGYILDEN